MARRMKLEGASVLGVAELLPYSNGLTRNIVQCLDDYNIPIYYSTTISEVLGKDRVEGVKIAKVDENIKPIPNPIHAIINSKNGIAQTHAFAANSCP